MRTLNICINFNYISCLAELKLTYNLSTKGPIICSMMFMPWRRSVIKQVNTWSYHPMYTNGLYFIHSFGNYNIVFEINYKISYGFQLLIESYAFENVLKLDY